MDYKNIDDLLKKYFESQTSREEESVLRAFLQSEAGTSDKYLQARAMFAFFSKEKSLESKLKIGQIVTKKAKVSRTRRMYFYAMAASIALLISFFFMQDNRPEKQVLIYINGQPVENQEVALAEAQKALLLVSKNLNDGTENLNYLSEFGTAEKILNGE